MNNEAIAKAAHQYVRDRYKKGYKSSNKQKFNGRYPLSSEIIRVKNAYKEIESIRNKELESNEGFHEYLQCIKYLNSGNCNICNGL